MQGQRNADVFKFQVMITTFEIVLSDCLELQALPWRACVIDEAHRLKNRNCKLLEGLRMLNLVSFSSFWVAVNLPIAAIFNGQHCQCNPSYFFCKDVPELGCRY